MPSDGCPPDADLATFDAGALAAADLDRVADHVRDCAACGRRLEGLDPASNSVLRALRAGGPATVLHDRTAQSEARPVVAPPAGGRGPALRPPTPGSPPGDGGAPRLRGSGLLLEREIR